MTTGYVALLHGLIGTRYETGLYPRRSELATGSCPFFMSGG